MAFRISLFLSLVLSNVLVAMGQSTAVDSTASQSTSQIKTRNAYTYQSKSTNPLSQGSTSRHLDPDALDTRFSDYEARLNAILKTRHNEEKQFVTGVLAMVRAGTLPERLIETSYKWVMNKRPDTNYPFVYFEKVLRVQASILEIELPAFDYEIYENRVFRSDKN